MLFLVRHGRPIQVRGVAAEHWELDPAGFDDGWEPLEECRARVTKAVAGILSAHAGEDVVLIGHGTAWTVLVSELTGTPPDLARWRDLGFPDLITVDA